MKPFTFIIAVLLTLSGCNVSNKVEPNQEKFPKEIKTTLIGKGSLKANVGINKSSLIIYDSKSWKELLNKMNAINNVSKDFKETSIDFDKYMVLAVFDNVHPNGGHSIDITSVKENKKNIIVKIDNLKKGNITSRITQPYHIVVIPKMNKPILFNMRGCATNDLKRETQPKKINPIVLGSGYSLVNGSLCAKNSPFGQLSHLVISNSKEWDALLGSYLSKNDIKKLKDKKVDFTKYTVLFVYKSMPHAGYELEFNLEEYTYCIRVTLKFKSGLLATPSCTYSIIKIPATSKPFTWVIK